jgi:hypothetical protein
VPKLRETEMAAMQAQRDGFGVLAIWNDCRAGREAEFEHWYQSEHLLERLAVPGFLLGRRYEAVTGAPRYFACYQTQSPATLTSAPYLARLNDPTPLTQRVMTEMFIDMTRALCRLAERHGHYRGIFAVTARFDEAPDDAALSGAAAAMAHDDAVACAELWIALAPYEVPVTNEETLRGRDRRIAACLTVETLRQNDGERIAAALSGRFPKSEVGLYRQLCAIERSS